MECNRELTFVNLAAWIGAIGEKARWYACRKVLGVEGVCCIFRGVGSNDNVFLTSSVLIPRRVSVVRNATTLEPRGTTFIVIQG